MNQQTEINNLIFTLRENEDNEFFYSVKKLENANIGYELRLPNEINGIPVLEIEEGGFADDTSINIIIIPETIKTIRRHAFKGCSSVIGVVIPETIEEIEEDIFLDIPLGFRILTSEFETMTLATSDDGKLIFTTLSDGTYSVKAANTAITGDIIIPGTFNGINVTQIAANGFYNCKAIGTVTFGTTSDISKITITNSNSFRESTITGELTLPNSLITVGYASFYNCDSLTSVTFGNSITSFSSYVFYGCGYIKSFSILPDTLLSIGTYAFYGCIVNTTNWVIPDSVTTIDPYAFYDSRKTSAFHIGKNVKTLGSGNGSSYSNHLKTITIDPANKYFKLDGNCVIEISTNTCKMAASGWTIPSYTKIISAYCFQSKPPASNPITIPATCEKIEGYAFYSAGVKGAIHIPKACVSLASGTIFGGSTISTNITSLTVDPENTKYHSNGNCIIETDTNKLLIGCRLSVIPNYVTEIANSAFYVNYGLQSITIPDSVTRIGTYTFYLNNALKIIVIPKNVKIIDNYAFNQCTALRAFILDTDTRAVSYANTLASCNNLSTVLYTKEGVYEEGSSWGGKTLVYVPQHAGILTFNKKDNNTYSVKAYNSVILPANVVIPKRFRQLPVTEIEESGFASCTTLNYISIPNSITSMGANTFKGCTKLKTVLNKSNTKLPSNTTVFSGCNNLKNVYYLSKTAGYTDGSKWCEKTIHLLNGHLFMSAKVNG